MCDYSLMAIPNRLAVSGEELVVHRFEEGSVGLASPLDLQKRRECRKVQGCGVWAAVKELFSPQSAPSIAAVCVPPGARLLVRDIPERLQWECGVQEEAEEVVFTQITAVVNTFRDAIRFPNGVEVLLQRLEEGQRVRVLNLSSAEDREALPHSRRRVMV